VRVLRILLLSVASVVFLSPGTVTAVDVAEGPVPGESPMPGESTAPAPVFEEELLRRSTPDVPLFVGPATLELSGEDGAYRWNDVRFGAQEVSVEIDAGGTACLAHLRLVEDGKPLVDEWFELSGPVETTLGIDYASARLRIDTDCPAWTIGFVPLRDPELPYTVRNTWYPVRGKTIDALSSQVQHIDGTWAAYTEWFTSWEYSVEEGDLLCLAANGETQLSATIELPNWKRPTSADPTLVAEWQRYTDSLTTHELGHVTIALQGADAIDDRLDDGFSAETCAQVADDADARSSQILEKYNQLSARYDEATGHGSSQGVELE